MAKTRLEQLPLLFLLAVAGGEPLHLLEGGALLVQRGLVAPDRAAESDPEHEQQERHHAAAGEEEQAPLARRRVLHVLHGVGDQGPQAFHHAPPGCSPEHV